MSRSATTPWSAEQRSIARAISDLAYCNPFLPERIACERRALGAQFVEGGDVWHLGVADETPSPNVRALKPRVEALVESARERLVAGARARPEELVLYQDAAIYHLYSRYEERLAGLVTRRGDARRAPFAREFQEQCRRYLKLPGLAPPDMFEPEVLFALFFQLRRAFHLIFHCLVGGSMPAARLRAAVWQSIFTHDLRRYLRGLYRRMGDVTTLITGPSGTGKELVARSIGMSRFIPFDQGAGAFVEDFEDSFFPLNLSALSPTLIESELFGHRRGAFTGSVEDRRGWLELCPALGTVFLDEIGEVDPAIQVKLLRVLETRIFQRLGDTANRRFEGKIVAATNRDPAAEMERGRLRPDFYYRLCSDLVTTPSLAEQLHDSPGELHALVLFLVRRVAGEQSAEALAEQVERWIAERLGPAYPWPGNVRELEQCVRNIMIRGEYHPRRPGVPVPLSLDELAGGRLTAEEALRRYVTHVYRLAGSYQEASRRLGLDRRTVKARVDAGSTGGAG